MRTNAMSYQLSGWAIGLVVLLMGLTLQSNGQGVSISETNSPPDPSAMLDVQSVNSGMLIPRMTAGQRNAIASPANGLMVYQTATSGGQRRGFWYYDGANSQWIHLGRGEYVGIIDQTLPAGSGVVSSSHFPNESSLGPGQSTLSWFEPTITTPPTVIVTPEFTVVGTPPGISDYCAPDNLVCSNFGRMNQIRVFYPASAFVGLINNDPPMQALMYHNCAAENVNYQYVAQDGGAYSNGVTEFNDFTLDLCTGDGRVAFFMQGGTTNPKSMTMWVDGNQDGDFADPGEMIDDRSLIPPYTSNQWYFGDPAILGALSGNPNWWYWDIAASLPNINDGLTKMRLIIRDNQPPTLDPCFPGDGNSKTYDFDMEVVCGGGGPAFYPNDLNWCNVDDVTTFSARVSCFDKEGTLTDMKFHYKIIRHD